MPQVIEVRLLHPETREPVGDEFTSADSHESAIDLALWNWSDGLAVIKKIERTEDEQGVRSKNSWRYVYHVTLEDENKEGERHVLAVLFATYKVKEAQEKQP
jgi:hypothetical protein